jgi:hypothetical protein
MSEDKKAPVIDLEALQLLIDETAETAIDMTEETAGGSGRKLLPKGSTLGRIVEYIEFGDQPQEFEGQTKAPAPEISIGCVLYDEGYTNDDGTPYIDHGMPFAVTRTAKSNAFKAFKVLNWQGTATRWLQLVGKPYLFEFDQKTSAKTKKPYSINMLQLARPPLDPRSKKPYDCPPVDPTHLRVFLWDAPQLAHWDSLEIKGNNFIQEKILGALNFAGSPLEQLLLTAGREIKIPVKKADDSKKIAESGAAGPDAAGPDAGDEDIPFDGGKPVETGEVATPDMPDAM